MHFKRLLCALAAAAMVVGLVQAGGVGPMLPIWTDVIDNVDPDAAFAPPHVSFLTVWCSKQDDFTWDIWARPVTAEGALLPGFNVDSSAGVRLWEPAVAYGSVQDEYLVVYTHKYSDTDYDIWAHQTKWNAIGPTSRIAIDWSLLKQQWPAVAYSPQADEFLVVYTSEIDTTPTYEVHAARVSAATGAVVGYGVVAASSSGDFRGVPDVAYDPVNNRYVIAYQFEGGGTFAILVKTVSTDLSSISPEQQVASGWYVQNPAVAVGPGGILIAWELYLSNSGEVYSRRATLDGTPLGPPGGFEIAAGANYIYLGDVDVAFDGPGGYLVVWDSFDGQTAAEGDVHGRYMSMTKDEATSPPFLVDDRPAYQGQPAVASVGERLSLVVLVHDPGPPDPDDEIQGYLVSSGTPDIDVDPLAMGSTQPPDTVVISALDINNIGDADLDWAITEEPGAIGACSAPADVPWLSVAPDAGTTPPAGTAMLDVTFDSTGLGVGAHHANLCIVTNDPDPGPGNGTELVIVVVELNVEGTDLIFEDGFESGDVLEWSAVTP